MQSKFCAEDKHKKCDLNRQKLVCGKQGLISKQSKETRILSKYWSCDSSENKKRAN